MARAVARVQKVSKAQAHVYPTRVAKEMTQVIDRMHTAMQFALQTL